VTRRLPVLVLIAASLAGCGGPRLAVRGDDGEAYRRAVADAAVAEPHEVSRGLRAVVPGEPGLVWRGEGPAARVLVATWTKDWPGGFQEQVGQSVTTKYETWVTLAPEVRERCSASGLAGLDLVSRLEQLHGLPPGAGKVRFVELWVSPDDLFRPCPDPEVTDHECSLVPPAPAARVTVAAEHVAWMADLTARSYGEGGYPWTRLGYAYDWGTPGDPVGPSEFVLRPGAEVEVAAAPLTEEYCR
jgi:hypothetical protein